ncbi:sulfotransferase family protein [Tateyamaria pelophila]|uniref:sulfotransferase family protein n=1 Tax=Tateyamaria pelophila TaxID=328415 RepID=UPI001CBFC769|nr:sulfotransferase family protein [Tateyamaria pelophila]
MSSEKVFGIGLSKTGTTSLADALRLLGYRVADYPTDLRTLEQLRTGDYRLDVLETHDALTDTPAALCFKQLDALYPGSRFVLTERADRARWLRSVRDHWAFTEEWNAYAVYQAQFYRFMNVAVYGLEKFEEHRFETVYDRHAAEVRTHFADRPEDLLVLDVTAGQGWPELCGFLGRLVPDAAYPHSNSRKEKVRARAWMAELDRISRQLAAAAALGSLVAVLDDQGLAGSPIERGWRCRALLSENGVPMGTPRDGTQAVAALEARCAEGCRSLLIWKPACAWWFEAYPAWSARLSQLFEPVFDDERLAIYRAREA